ncbi:MAG: transporter substrate-binding domain-containing protein [Alteromonadales bacterium]|nr:transporter substrate-binding domain-containing protein [Alteromonadales bacterium]
MNKFTMTILFCSLVVLCASPFKTFAHEKTYKASLALLPVAAESKESGVLVDLVKLWEKATGKEIKINVSPFKRSLRDAINNKVDFHLPLIKNPYKNDSKQDFDYSTSVIFTVSFVLYTNKTKHINKNRLSDYALVTEPAHKDLFDFAIEENYRGIAHSLKMLNKGVIDGYIFADVEADPVLKKLGLKNIKRELYKIYDVHAVLPKGEKGKGVDIIISKAMNKIRESGEWEVLMSPVYHEYIDWQP